MPAWTLRQLDAFARTQGRARRLVYVALTAMILTGCDRGGCCWISNFLPDSTVRVESNSRLVESDAGCRVRAIIVNTSDRWTVNASVHWTAFNASGVDISNTTHEVRDLPAGEREEAESKPFLTREGAFPMRCATIARFQHVGTTVWTD